MFLFQFCWTCESFNMALNRLQSSRYKSFSKPFCKIIVSQYSKAKKRILSEEEFTFFNLPFGPYPFLPFFPNCAIFHLSLAFYQIWSVSSFLGYIINRETFSTNILHYHQNPQILLFICNCFIAILSYNKRSR